MEKKEIHLGQTKIIKIREERIAVINRDLQKYFSPENIISKKIIVNDDKFLSIIKQALGNYAKEHKFYFDRSRLMATISTTQSEALGSQLYKILPRVNLASNLPESIMEIIRSYILLMKILDDDLYSDFDQVPMDGFPILFKSIESNQAKMSILYILWSIEKKYWVLGICTNMGKLPKGIHLLSH